MYIECNTLGEGLRIGGSASGSLRAMKESENPNSASTTAEDVDLHETSEEPSKAADIRERLRQMISGDSSNFNSWTALIDEVERSCPDNIDAICFAYDSFLSKFPLCHWYWRKYAYEMIRLSDPNKAVEIFECALNLAMHSLGLWLDYCRFGMSFFEDKGAVRRLFKTGILFLGKDYCCHALWDQYITFEFSQQNWSSLANIYLQVLRFPTEKLHNYYENFKKFVSGMEEEMSQDKNYEKLGVLPDGETLFSENDVSRVIEELQSPDNEAVRSRAVHKYKSIGDQFYKKACELDEQIKRFEANIQRRYFDVTPLGDEELKTWHQYLDFMEKHGDFSWALQLFERCLISCANYPEFWIRYVEFMESKGGRELANFALERATKIFVKDSLEIHLFSSRFKERVGDRSAARAAVMQRHTGSDFYLTRHVIELANMERRLGNTEAAYDVYHKAISMAEEKQQWNSLSTLFVHLSRLKYTITGSADAARDVLIDGIQRVPHCRVLLEELIKFVMMHQGASQVDLLDSIIARAISPSTDESQVLNPKDREDISSLFLEYVDLCGTVDDIRKATNRHIQLFPEFLRPKFVCKNLDLDNDLDNLSDEISGQKRAHSSALHQLQFENPRSKINKIEEKQVHIPPVDHDYKANLVSAGHSPQKCDEKNEQEKRKKSSNQVEQSSEAATDLKVVGHDFINELAKDTSGVIASLHSSAEEQREDRPESKVTHDLNQPLEDVPGVVGAIKSLAEEHRQDEPGQMAITPTSIHNSSGDAPAPNSLACNLDDHQSRPTALVEPSEEQSSSVNMQVQGFKHHRSPVYFEKLSPNSQGKASQEIISVVSNEHDATLGTSKTNRNALEVCLNANAIPCVASPNSTSTADSPQIRQHPVEVTTDIPFSPISHPKHMAVEVQMNSTVTPSTGGELQKIEHNDTISEGGTSETPSHLEDQQLPPQQRNATVAASEKLMTQADLHHSVTKMGGPTEVQQETCPVQQNMFTDHIRPVNAMPDQSSLPTDQPCKSSPLFSCPQPNLTSNTLQFSHQGASPHQSQTMNQTWQLNYQQHQQLLQQQYQHQHLQMKPQQQQHQQSYQHQQQFLTPQQQHNQQQAYSSQQQPQFPIASYQVTQFQQQQPQYFQQAQQQPNQYQLFMQQAQLQQGQQQQFLQQQLYHQAEKLAYQMQQQGYEQHTAQAYAYQMVWQQYQLYQHGYDQPLQQGQHHQQLQHVYNQMELHQQQQLQVLQQQQQNNEQNQHYQNRSPYQDLSSQNLQGQENAKEGPNSGHENTPESGSQQPQY